MRMTDAQVAQYQRDGFIIFPALFSKAEIAALRAETARLSAINADTVIREHSGGVRSIFRVHEDDGATHSPAFRALVRTPRVLEPTRQALGGDVYVYHTKINTKPAIEGTVWMWHQDYGSWKRDRCPRSDMGTFAVMMTDSVEMNGALYVATAGTCVLFHCNLLHASGHNLSAEDRWHIYISFNACANAPQFGPQSRPDWVVSRNTRPLPVEADDAILERNSVLST